MNMINPIISGMINIIVSLIAIGISAMFGYSCLWILKRIFRAKTNLDRETVWINTRMVTFKTGEGFPTGWVFTSGLLGWLAVQMFVFD